MREGKAGADHSGKLGAVAARAEQPDRRQRNILRHRVDFVERMAFGKLAVLEQQQFLEAFEEIVAAGILLAPPQHIRGHLIGAGRAPDAEIDAAGKQRLEHLEPFGHHQRRMVRQHDAARADADALGRGGDLADHDLGRRACDRGQVVMLRHPVAADSRADRQGARDRSSCAAKPRRKSRTTTGERSRTESGTMRRGRGRGQNGQGRYRRQSCFQPVRRPRRNCSARPFSTG